MENNECKICCAWFAHYRIDNMCDVCRELQSNELVDQEYSQYIDKILNT